MGPDLLDLYDRGSAWAVEMVPGATDQLDAATPCDEWNVRSLLNHMLDTQRYFLSSARGEEASRPSPTPPEMLSDDPVADFRKARGDMLAAYSASGVVEKTGPSLGIAFSDLLLHGWDLARATGQDAAMPNGLAEADYELIHGRFTDEQRKGIFKPEVPVGKDASAQDRLVAYSGRDPS
jgi:uncharacterized protein (TIGR03086 family)